MGAQSSLGPINCLLGGLGAAQIVEEFENAKKQIKLEPNTLIAWKVFLEKMQLGFITNCKYSAEMADEMLKKCLFQNMFKDKTEQDRENSLKKLRPLFVDYTKFKIHDRHINRETLKAVGLNINDLESDEELEDLVLSLHHLLWLTFERTQHSKIIATGAGGGAAYFH